MSNFRTIKLEDWIKEGEALFGKNRMQWWFKCPCCDFQATGEHYRAAGAPEGSIGISCIGRWCKGKVRNAFSSEGKGPCDYSGGGLFRLNPVEVDFGENNKVGFFEFGKDPKENE